MAAGGGGGGGGGGGSCEEDADWDWDLEAGGGGGEAALDGRLPEAEAAEVMYAVFKFLEACHGARVVFGDVKPANFLLKFSLQAPAGEGGGAARGPPSSSRAPTSGAASCWTPKTVRCLYSGAAQGPPRTGLPRYFSGTTAPRPTCGALES